MGLNQGRDYRTNRGGYTVKLQTWKQCPAKRGQFLKAVIAPSKGAATGSGASVYDMDECAIVDTSIPVGQVTDGCVPGLPGGRSIASAPGGKLFFYIR